MPVRDFAVNERLRELMRLYGLRRADVCRILGLPVRKNYSHGTLDNWLSMRHRMAERDLRIVVTYLHARNLVEAAEDEANLRSPEG